MSTGKESLGRPVEAGQLSDASPPNGHVQKKYDHANGHKTRDGLLLQVQHPGTPLSLCEETPPIACPPSEPSHPIVSSVPRDARVAFQGEESPKKQSLESQATEEPVIPFLEAISQAPIGGQPEGLSPRSESSSVEKSPSAKMAVGQLAGEGKKKVSWPDLHGSALTAVREFEAR